ncbi:MAG: ABC transporter permease [Eubacteriales bacterium]
MKTLNRDKTESFVIGTLGILSFLLFWQIGVSFTQFGLIFPAPIDVFQGILVGVVEPIGKVTLIGHVAVSLSRVAVGYICSAVLGTLVGLVMGASKMGKALLNGVFNMIKPIPGIAWIPLAILWFGTGNTTIYFIIFVGGFSQMVMNTMAGAENVSQELIGVAQVLGLKKNRVFTTIILPSAVPYIFAGLQISLSTSWMAVLAAEMITATSGCGWLITAGMQGGGMTNSVIGMIAIGVIGLILAALMRACERRLCTWKERG